MPAFDPTPLTYYFEARVLISRAVWNEFQARHDGVGDQKIVDLLEGAGLLLRHAAVYNDPDFHFFYNFWELGESANTLADVERALADKVLWAEFIKLVDREEDKDLLYPLTTATQTVLPPNFSLASAKYLRIAYDLMHYGVSEFRARLEEELSSAGATLGWYLGNTYLQHTGREGRVVQVWMVPPSLDLAQVKADVAALPWMRPLPSGNRLYRAPEPDVRLLDRSSFDRNAELAAGFLPRRLVAA